jgi:hypothetical protein
MMSKAMPTDWTPKLDQELLDAVAKYGENNMTTGTLFSQSDLIELLINPQWPCQCPSSLAARSAPIDILISKRLLSAENGQLKRTNYYGASLLNTLKISLTDGPESHTKWERAIKDNVVIGKMASNSFD